MLKIEAQFLAFYTYVFLPNADLYVSRPRLHGIDWLFSIGLGPNQQIKLRIIKWDLVDKPSCKCELQNCGFINEIPMWSIILD